MKDRVLLSLPALEIWFLPAFSEFLLLADDHLGNPSTLIKKIADDNGLKAPDRKTISAAHTNGVTRSKADQIFAIYRAPLEGRLDPFQPDQLNESQTVKNALGNGKSWECGLEGLRASVIGGAISRSWFESFIMRRVEQESAALAWIRDREIERRGGQLDAEPYMDFARSFLKENTQVSPELISLISSIDPYETDRNSNSWRWAKNLKRVVNHQLRVDFYYTLICEVSIDVAEYLANHGLYEQHKTQFIEHGIFGDIAPGSTSSDFDSTAPFVKLLGSWKERISELCGEDVGWREMSTYLPPALGVPDEERAISGTSLPKDNRYSKIKKWRRGVMPRPDQWEAFIENMFSDHDPDLFLAWVKSITALSWTRFLKEEMEVLERVTSEAPELDGFSALGKYQQYWARYRDQAAAIAAT